MASAQAGSNDYLAYAPHATLVRNVSKFGAERLREPIAQGPEGPDMVNLGSTVAMGLMRPAIRRVGRPAA